MYVEELYPLFIITNSPTGLHHTKECAFLTKKINEENKVDFSWILTESGHGNGPMDGIGAAIKNSIEDTLIVA